MNTYIFTLATGSTVRIEAADQLSAVAALRRRWPEAIITNVKINGK